MTTVSVITPWLNGSELIPGYRRIVGGMEIIAVDNASEPEHAEKIERMATVYLRNETNRGFAGANNQGFAASTGDIVVFANSDIEGPALMPSIIAQVRPGNLYGPAMRYQKLDSQMYEYLEGYFIAATRSTWELVGLWPELPGPYWEDNILAWNAKRKNVGLVRANWPVWHYGNYTSKKTPGAYDHSAGNREIWAQMVRNGR